MRRVWIVIVPLLLVLLVPAAAVGVAAKDRTGRTETYPTLASATTVKIVDFAFRPKTISIAKGTRVRWVNKGSLSHTTTAKGGQWDSGNLASGDAFSRTFKKAGTFRYYCTIHPSMVGKVVVS